MVGKGNEKALDMAALAKPSDVRLLMSQSRRLREHRTRDHGEGAEPVNSKGSEPPTFTEELLRPSSHCSCNSAGICQLEAARLLTPLA
jgi:hypothetical protein